MRFPSCAQRGLTRLGSTHDFSILLNLPPGTHRIKFIVDDHWRCSNDLQTATDGDGNLVNWLEVDVPRREGAALGQREEEDWAQADWAQKVSNELDDGEYGRVADDRLLILACR